MGQDCTVPRELCEVQMKNMDRRLEAIEQTQKEIWSKLNRLQVNLTAIKAQWSLIGLIAAIVIDVLLRLWKP